MTDFGRDDACRSSPPGLQDGRAALEQDVNKTHVEAADDNPDTSTYLNESLCRQVMREMKLQRRSTNFCDIKLIVNSQIAHFAHKCVLAANSTYFNALFTNDPTLNCLALESKNPKTVEVLLDYMYTGELSVGASYVEELIESSEKLSMTDIKQCINLHLEKNIDITNCFEMYHLAETYHLVDLKVASDKFFVDNFSVISQGQEILFLDIPLFHRLLSECNKDRDVDVELYKLEAIMKWTLYSYERRGELLAELIKLLYPDVISKEGFEHVANKLGVTEHPIVTDSQLSVFYSVICLRLEAEQLREQEDRQALEEARQQLLEEALLKKVQEKEARIAKLEKANIEKAEKVPRTEDVTSVESPSEIQKQTTPVDDEVKEENGEEAGVGDGIDDVSDADTDIYQPSTEDIDKVLDGNPLVKSEEDPGSQAPWIGVTTGRGRRKRKSEIPLKIPKTEGQPGSGDGAAVVKRGRGRPRKNPLTLATLPKKKVVSALREKGPRGRPPKNKVHPANGSVAVKEEKIAASSDPVVPEQRVKRKYVKRKGVITKGPVRCGKCPREFPTLDALKRHERGHGKDVPFLCDECGFTTIHYASIRLHQKRHSGNKFICTFPGCTYTNVRKERFRDHMNGHQGIKEHVCSVCGKAFASRKHMQRHEKLHRGLEKNIVCEKCDWKTGRRDRLREHVVRHHPEWGIMTGAIKQAHLEKAREHTKPRLKKKKEPKVKKEEPPTIVQNSEILPSTMVNMALEAISPPPPMDPQPVPVMTAPTALEGTSTLSDEMKQYLTGLSATVAMQVRGVIPIQDIPGIVTNQDKPVTLPQVNTDTVAVQQNAGDYRWYYVNTGPDGNTYACQQQPPQPQPQQPQGGGV